MAGPETATIELRSLREALNAGDELAWRAFTHAALAADGREAHAGLGRCAGCRRGWSEATGPLALVEAVLDGERAVGLLCEACAFGGDVPTMLERLLRAMLPEDARVVETHVLRAQPVGHA